MPTTSSQHAGELRARSTLNSHCLYQRYGDFKLQGPLGGTGQRPSLATINSHQRHHHFSPWQGHISQEIAVTLHELSYTHVSFIELVKATCPRSSSTSELPRHILTAADILLGRAAEINSLQKRVKAVGVASGVGIIRIGNVHMVDDLLQSW